MTNFNAKQKQHQFQGQPAAVPAMPINGGKYEIRFGDPQETLQTHCTRCT